MIPKPGARVRIALRPTRSRSAPGDAGLARGTGRGGGTTARDRGDRAHEPPGRHPPGDALAVDQPAARRAARAAGAAAGLGPLAAGHGTPAGSPTAAAGCRCTTCRCRRWRSAISRSAAPGKTPIAIWIARHYVSRGLRPGILLRGLRQRRDAGAPALGARGRSSWPIPTGPPGAERALAQRRAGAGARRRLPAARRPPRPQHRW